MGCIRFGNKDSINKLIGYVADFNIPNKEQGSHNDRKKFRR